MSHQQTRVEPVAARADYVQDQQSARYMHLYKQR